MKMSVSSEDKNPEINNQDNFEKSNSNNKNSLKTKLVLKGPCGELLKFMGSLAGEIRETDHYKNLKIFVETLNGICGKINDIKERELKSIGNLDRIAPSLRRSKRY